MPTIVCLELIISK